MRIPDLGRLAFRALTVNKGRTVLTMLGIVIGILSVILMVSVGEAAQRYLLTQIASFGSDLVFVSNGRGDEMRGGPPSTDQKQSLTTRDYAKLQDLTWPKAITTSVIIRDLVEYGGSQMLTQVTGGAPGEVVVMNVGIESGRFLLDDDIESRSRVVVLGRKVRDRLFGQEDPVGRTMKIGRQPFKVIGVLKPAGSKFFSDADDQVYIPFTASLDVYNKDRLNFFAIKTGTVRPSDAKELVRIALRETHNIDNPEGILAKDDFRVASQEDAIRNAATIGTVLQILLGSIASISLVVAGIGIMNIMYVAVTERTREIGLRKAVGARSRDVLGQFLAEAILLTVSAGLIGVASGVSMAWLAIQVISHYQTGWIFAIPWTGVGIGFGVSVAIGVIFGYFPAKKAAALNPIEALRHE